MLCYRCQVNSLRGRLSVEVVPAQAGTQNVLKCLDSRRSLPSWKRGRE
jgi:hypothetical protein